MNFMKINFRNALLGTASALCLSATAAVSEPVVEVMHFWTSGGEAAALGAVRDEVVARGVGWEDQPVAGGGGDQAKTVMQARITAGNPPTAMLMLGQNIIDWANEGLLSNVNAVAEREGWDAVVPGAVQEFTKVNGNWVSSPTNVHRTDMIWASKSAFDKIGAEYPTTWDEFNALAPRFLEAGIIPLAHGGQAWQEAYMFEAVALGVGADFYRKALVDLDDATLRGSDMAAVFDQMAALRGMVDENFPGRDWNLANSMVINGEAAMQIMGDWAKGEFTNADKMAGSDFACVPVPKANGQEGFVYLVNSPSFFEQTDPEKLAAQEVLASAIMDPAVQIAFNQAKGAIPARSDLDVSALDACAQETSASLTRSDKAGTAVPTFAGTHAANASVVGAATDVITEFFNSDMSAAEAAGLLADAIKDAL